MPINDFAIANEELAKKATEGYYSCCGKSICRGCVYSFDQSGHKDRCPFCNADCGGKSEEERVQEMMKRVEANDAGAMFAMGNSFYHGLKVCCRIMRRQWNYLLSQQSLVIVRHIVP